MSVKGKTFIFRLDEKYVYPVFVPCGKGSIVEAHDTIREVTGKSMKSLECAYFDEYSYLTVKKGIKVCITGRRPMGPQRSARLRRSKH